MANQQCCDSFRWTAKGLSHTYTCIHSPPKPLPSHSFLNIVAMCVCVCVYHIYYITYIIKFTI